MTNSHGEAYGKIPAWLIEMGYEEGDDLADFDAFECERCGRILDNDDSIRAQDSDGDNILICPRCSGS